MERVVGIEVISVLVNELMDIEAPNLVVLVEDFLKVGCIGPFCF